MPIRPEQLRWEDLGSSVTSYALLDQLLSEGPASETCAARLAALGSQLLAIRSAGEQQGFRLQLLCAARIAASEGLPAMADEFTRLATKDAPWLVTPNALEATEPVDGPISVGVQDGPAISAAIERELQNRSVVTGPDLEAKYRFAAIKQDRHGLSISLVPTTWTDAKRFHSIVEHDPSWARGLPDGWWISPVPFGDCMLPGIAVVHAIIITSDQTVIAAQRSAQTSYRPLHWSISFEEQLNDKDVNQKGDPFSAAARRGLKEEFGVDVAAQDIVPLATVMQVDVLNLGLIFLLRLSMTADQLINSWKFTAKDRWEANEVRAIPLRSADASIASLGQLHPTSEMRLLALRRWLQKR